MSVEDFFSKDAKARAKKAVQEIESQSAAEIVVVVKRRAEDHLEAELAGALVFAFGMLLFVLFHPHPFAVEGIPFRILLAGLFGFALVRWLSPLKRAFVSRSKRERSVRNAARAAFVDLGVSKTRGRTGILVFVSALERTCELVCDVGVERSAVDGAARALQSAVDRFDFDALVKALESMGPALGKILPRAADDVNELPDEVVE